MRQRPVISAFNRGIVSQLGLARVEDIKRIAISAQTMRNWMPRVLGSMMLRPGLGYVSGIKNNAQSIEVPFVFSVDDMALLEISGAVMRVRINDILVTRAAVSSAITNGAFGSNISGWTDDDEAGAVSSWLTGGYASLVGTGTNAARLTQQVTVIAADRGVEHALRIVIKRGPVVLRVGSTSGADDYVSETTLGTGTHSITLTPTGDFYVRVQNSRARVSLVDGVAVEGAGTLELTTPWATADLRYVRWDDSQSADVIFVACKGYQQRKIERRTTRSWSVVLYEPEDGPFRIENVGPVTITPSAITGDITLTSSAPLFKSTHAPSANSGGALFRLTSEGQRVTASIGAQNTFTNAIRVTGVGSDRTFTINVTGTWVATASLQRSLDSETGPWSDVSGKTWTANTTETYADGLNNQIVWYRIGVKTGGYTSGTMVAELAITIGSITGVARITGFSTTQSVTAAVLKDLGGTGPTDIWSEGVWSDYRLWPSAGCLYEGRMWWAGKDKIIGSVSDAFESFDPDTLGDSGPINRSIGSGPVDTIAWLLPLQRLIAGTEGSEVSCRSSALDEPLTPTAFNPKEATTQGSALVAAVKRDSTGIFVQRGQVRVYELAHDSAVNANDYSLRDLTLLAPEIGSPGIVKIAIQRQPDTRIWCVRSDGTVAIAIIDKAENVLCWVEFVTDGNVEDVAILPGAPEDRVYVTTKRRIGGADVRYLEKLALESECQGGASNRQADSFVTFTSASPTMMVTGLSTLEGKDVLVWADGIDRSPGTPDEDEGQTLYTVTAGRITVTVGEPFTTAVIGIPYTAPWKNAKLALALAMGSSLTQPKNIAGLGIIAINMHPKGLKYGRDFDHLDDLPQVFEGAPVDPHAVFEDYDTKAVPFPGEWRTDSRLCLQAQAPRPCTLLAAVMTVEANG